MKQCIRKSVNYDKIREITQGKEEKSALFCHRLVEAFRKYTNLDPSCLGGQVLMGQHFSSQSAPDICRKLKKLYMGPQTPNVLTNRHCLNCDLEEREEQIQHRKKGAEGQAKVNNCSCWHH